MVLDPFTWVVLISVALTATVFWDDIKKWANKAYKSLLRGIDRAVTIVSDAIIYLYEEGGKIYERIEVFLENTYNEITTRNTKSNRIPSSNVPSEFRNKVKGGKELALMKIST